MFFDTVYVNSYMAMCVHPVTRWFAYLRRKPDRLNARQFIRNTTGLKTSSSHTAAGTSFTTSNHTTTLPFNLRRAQEDEKHPHLHFERSVDNYGMKSFRRSRHVDGDEYDHPVLSHMQRAYDRPGAQAV